MGAARIAILTCVCAAIAITCGCATVHELAPPVNLTTLRLGAVSDADMAQLEHGRSIYVMQCARCHSPEPVTRYTQNQWNTILPRMTEHSQLNQKQDEALRAYIAAVLQTLSENDQ